MEGLTLIAVLSNVRRSGDHAAVRGSLRFTCASRLIGLAILFAPPIVEPKEYLSRATRVNIFYSKLNHAFMIDFRPFESGGK